MKDKNQAEHLNVILAISSFILIVTGVTFIGYLAFGTSETDIEGQMDCREYRVSSKFAARIEQIRVHEGDYVHVGDTLVVLSMPEVEAQERAAKATGEAAQAISEMTDNGARIEQIRTSADLLSQAQAALTIAEKTLSRVQRLYDEGVTTAQKRDEAQAARDAAAAQVSAAQSQYEMVKKGARTEEKKAAAYQAQAASHGTDVVRSMLRETVQVATVEGEVQKIDAHEGELVSSGSPILTISMLSDQWSTFFIREDRLHAVKMGDDIKTGKVITVHSEAYDRDYPMRVYYIKVQPEYATWKATKADKGVDLHTFEVRARPVKFAKELRPGMTVTIKE